MGRTTSGQAAVILVLAGTLAACGGSTEAASVSATTVVPTSLKLTPESISTTTAPPRTPDAEALPELAELSPGVRYEAPDVTPAISLEVSDVGWRQYPLPPFEVSDLIDLGKNIQPDSFESDISIGVLRVTDVWTNFLVADPVQPVEDQYVVPAPSDLVGWFQSHPYLRLSELTSTTVAGYPAARFTADVPPLPAEAEGTCHGERCTMLFSLESPAGYTSQWEGEHVTYWVVDATAHRFVITMIINPDATPEEADVLAGEGEAIVASIQIR